MSRNETHSYSESNHDESGKSQHEAYRVRRASASRRRTHKQPATPGGMRQRRNKHWNW